MCVSVYETDVNEWRTNLTCVVVMMMMCFQSCVCPRVHACVIVCAHLRVHMSVCVWAFVYTELMCYHLPCVRVCVCARACLRSCVSMSYFYIWAGSCSVPAGIQPTLICEPALSLLLFLSPHRLMTSFHIWAGWNPAMEVDADMILNKVRTFCVCHCLGNSLPWDWYQ